MQLRAGYFETQSLRLAPADIRPQGAERNTAPIQAKAASFFKRFLVTMTL